MDIFSADPGTVVLAEVNEGTPMNLHIDDWGGFNSFRSIVNGFKLTLKDGVQFVHTLNEFIFVYTFGARMGQIQLSGIAFYQDCQELGEVMQGTPDHGLEEIVGYYGLNRVCFRPTPVTIVLGTSTAFQCFLTDLSVDMAESEKMVGTWALTFAVVPG